MYRLLTVLLVVSSSLAFPAKEEISTKNSNVRFYEAANKTPFSTDNITIDYSTNEEFGLNITAISRVNNLDDFLLLVSNLTHNVSILNIGQLSFGQSSKHKLNPFEKNAYVIAETVSTFSVSKEGDLVLNASAGTVQSLKLVTDFTDLQKRPRIEYNLTVVTEVNMTWITKSGPLKNKVTNLPSHISDPQPYTTPNFTALVPLVNGTFNDESSCRNEICKSTSKSSYNTGSYYVFDDITVTFERYISKPNITSTRFENGSNTTYAVISTTDVKTVIVVGPHRC
ncbi:uncharacterized protein LOC126885183 [Diabrotica virgifera virgifera]|uniref:Uncharacterized protein n=1 Tax=Diabrotica virgifera virgifera TaxID=50390 RepID=A0ABM5KBL0_DIAVI|nr:uncharacterized protein LOC126885183 [Diabrotica virgifera virgifera]